MPSGRCGRGSAGRGHGGMETPAVCRWRPDGIATGPVGGRGANRRGCRAGAGGGRRDAEPGSAAAGAGRAGQCGDRRRRAGWWAACSSLHDLGRRPQGLRRAAGRLAGRGEGRAEGRFEARQTRGPDAAGRPRGGDLAAAAPLAQAKEGEGQVVLLSGEPGLASRACARSAGRGSPTSPHCACSTNARRTTRRARCIP